MRLRKLHIQRYGHFADAMLDFPGDGLQVIHGHNEAGKSTLLQFVREILFGFGERNRYAFSGEKLDGSAVLEFADHQTMELRRRHGRPEKLTLLRGDEPSSITEAELQSLLGGANGQLFQNVFAFGLSELANGEESLKIEAVQHALHGSGLSGLANPQRMLDQLTKDSEAIYKERGSKQEVAAICAEIKTLGTTLKEKITRTDTYLQRKRDHDAAKAEADQFAAQLSQLRRDHARLKKLATAYPLWRELTDLEERRRGLGDSSHLTTESRQQFEKRLDELKRLDRDTTKHERGIKTSEIELQKFPAQTEWLDLRSQIEQARERIILIQEARRDLPLLEAKLRLDQQQVQDGIKDVVTTWDVSQLEAFRCDADQRARGEQMAVTKRNLDNERIRLDERTVTLRKELADNQADLTSLDAPTDVTALQALLNQHAEQAAREARFARLIMEESKQQRAITGQIRKLSPPLPQNAINVESLPIPPGERIAEYEQRFAEARKSISVTEQSLSEARERQQQLKLELIAARGNLTEIPTTEELKRVRLHRDAGWRLIEDRYIKAQPDPKGEDVWLSPLAESLSASFQRSIAESDDYADKMFGNASLVHQQEQLEAAHNVVRAKQNELETQRLSLTSLEEKWRILWQPCGFEPFDPDVMSAWKSKHDHLLDLLGELADLKDEITHLQQGIDEFNSRLATVLPDFAGRPDERLAAAQELVKHHQQDIQDLRTFKRESTRLANLVAQLEENRRSFDARQSAFTGEWRSWLRDLHFPLDWPPDLALSVVDRLIHLRDKWHQIPELESRISSVQQALAEFDPTVESLCDQVAPQWRSQPAEVAARYLADNLESALNSDSRRAEIERDIVVHQAELDEIEVRHQATQIERQRLLDLAQADTDEGFWKEADRADAIRDIEGQIVAKQRELARLRDFEEESAFLAELQSVDYPALVASRSSLEQQINLLEEDERKANERKGATGKELEQLDGSAAAADIQSTITQRRAALANAIDRYVPLLFARQLLQQTLQRFEKESQPEMLNDVSRLFSALTGGRYQRVERPRDASRPLIVYRADNAEDLEPQELSTGTREQLYLAIRLAYVLHYCVKAEPLPIVLDDVFANFDPGRTRKSLEALGQITDRVQVLLFTCHPHVVALAQEVFPELQPVEVPGASLART